MTNEIVKLSGRGEVILKEDQVLPEDFDKIPHHMDFEVKMIEPGEVNSSITGRSDITVEDVVGLHDSYNEEKKMAFDSLINTKAKRFGANVTNISINDFLGKDVKKDHSDRSVDDIVGRVKGLFRLEGSQEQPELWGTIRVLGKENVIKVLDSRYTRLSVGFTRKAMHIRNSPTIAPELKRPRFDEISFVQIGAVRSSRVEDPKILHPVLLSGDKIEFQEEKPNYQIEIIKLVSKQLDFIDIELDNLQETRKIKSELNRLAFNGKILPKMIRSGKILNELLSIKNKADRNSILGLLDMMPNHLCLGGETNSLNAIKGMEMIMAGDKTATEKAKEHWEACKEKFENASPGEKQKLAADLRGIYEESVKCSSSTNGISDVSSISTVEGEKPVVSSISPHTLDSLTAFKFSGGQEEYLEGMEKLMSEGKHEDAKGYHAAYKKHCLEGKEVSTKEKEELAANEEKLSGYKVGLKTILDETLKGEIEQLNVKLSGLTDSISGMNDLAEQHKSLVAFVQAIAKDINKAN